MSRATRLEDELPAPPRLLRWKHKRDRPTLRQRLPPPNSRACWWRPACLLVVLALACYSEQGGPPVRQTRAPGAAGALQAPWLHRRQRCEPLNPSHPCGCLHATAEHDISMTCRVWTCHALVRWRCRLLHVLVSRAGQVSLVCSGVHAQTVAFMSPPAACLRSPSSTSMCTSWTSRCVLAPLPL